MQPELFLATTRLQAEVLRTNPEGPLQELISPPLHRMHFFNEYGWRTLVVAMTV